MQIFDEKLSPTAIVQGNVGDCYFLSSLSALAEWPARLKKNFITQTTNPEGVYEVSLCINGIFEEIFLDDYFPFDEEGGKWVFAQSKNEGIWA